MLTNLENKSMTTMSPAPDLAILRERITRLRAQETREEQQLHAAQCDLTAAETGISGALFSKAKGYETQGREALTSWMFAQSTAQKKILDAVDMLTKTRTELREASDALAVGEASVAARKAASFESEIIAELQTFAGEMLAYWRRCERIQALRERARDANLIAPAVLVALFPNWGEVMSFSVLENRLELIAKCTELPEEAAAIVHANARERSRAARAEIERGKKIEDERQRIIRQARNSGAFTTKVNSSFQNWIDEDGIFRSKELFDY